MTQLAKLAGFHPGFSEDFPPTVERPGCPTLIARSLRDRVGIAYS